MATFSLTLTDKDGVKRDIIHELESRDLLIKSDADDGTVYRYNMAKSDPVGWKDTLNSVKKNGYRALVYEENKDEALANQSPSKDTEWTNVTASDATDSMYQWYRRDYTDEELYDISNPKMHADTRTGELYYFGPETVSVADYYASHVSSGLDDLVTKEHVHWSWNSGYDNYYVGGRCCTPDGHIYDAVIPDVNVKSIKDTGDGRKCVSIYVDTTDKYPAKLYVAENDILSKGGMYKRDVVIRDKSQPITLYRTLADGQRLKQDYSYDKVVELRDNASKAYREKQAEQVSQNVVQAQSSLGHQGLGE